jgi:predicted unusual protein kinase regulating ubiquinone biosynthesis (AarF/ABC1/UbiB family)
MIFGAGFLHGDPHPGNIFIGEGGKVSLIDCGQFKALPRPQRVKLAELVLAVANYQDATADGASDDKVTESKNRLAKLVQAFGVPVAEENQKDTDLWCSVALFLFGNADQTLPGNGKYSANELDDNSPIKLVTSFPQELVLLGRATVLLKGIAKKLEVPFSLADKWGPGCALTMKAASEPQLPLWGKEMEVVGADPSDSISKSGTADAEKVRFLQVVRVLKTWGKGKSNRFLERVVKRLPPNLKTRVLEAELRRQERKELEMKEKMKASRE